MRLRVAWVIGGLVALFALRPLLEASMTAQMLVQIPLLIAAGALLGKVLPVRCFGGVAAWNHGGISGLVLATLTVTFWMLPRSLDAAASEPLTDVAKYLSLPLLAGTPLALSWPSAGFIVRGVFLLELIASCFRLGWLYLISPLRLCNNYALDDQQRLGEYLLVLGAGLFVWIACKLLWGDFDTLRLPHDANK